MKIVVTTPTGHVGSHVTRLLLQAGAQPTVLVRDASKLDPAVLERLDALEGNQGDAEFVVRATRGADALFWIDPPTGDDDPLDGYARMSRSLVAAVTENVIPRVVFQSSVGAELRHGAGDIDGLAATETALDETDASVLHLRCGYFFTNLVMDIDSLKEGVLRTAMPLDQPMPWVDPRDIGEVAAARLLSTDWSGRVVQAVHGPEDLTYRRVAEVLSDALGTVIRAEHVSDDDVRSGLLEAGMTAEQADSIVGMSGGLRDGFVPEQSRDVTTTTPTRLGGWAFDHLAPLLRPAIRPSAS